MKHIILISLEKILEQNYLWKVTQKLKRNPAINYICILKSKLEKYSIYQEKKFQSIFCGYESTFKPAKNGIQGNQFMPCVFEKGQCSINLFLQSAKYVSEQLLCTTGLWQLLKVQWWTRQGQSLSSEFRAYQGDSALKEITICTSNKIWSFCFNKVNNVF